MSALWDATRDNARACAKAAVHTKDCPECPLDLGGFLDAPLYQLCATGRDIRDAIAVSERAISRAVAAPPQHRELVQ